MIKPFQWIVDMLQVQPYVIGHWICKVHVLLFFMSVYYTPHWTWGSVFWSIMLLLFIAATWVTSEDEYAFSQMGEGTWGDFLRYTCLFGSLFSLLNVISEPTPYAAVHLVIEVLYFCWFCFAACRPPAPPKRRHQLSPQT